MNKASGDGRDRAFGAFERAWDEAVFFGLQRDRHALSRVWWDGRVPTWSCPKQDGMDAPCPGYKGTDARHMACPSHGGADEGNPS